MGPLDLLTGPLRSLLGEAEHVEQDAVHRSPLGETRELEAKLADAVSATHRAAESLEQHVKVIGALADSLAPLTESVTRLSDQIGELLRVTAPLAAAERGVSRFEHLFGRRHRAETQAPAQPQPPPDA
jgi:ABC-type transporter Mla subunit MlaD